MRSKLALGSSFCSPSPEAEAEAGLQSPSLVSTCSRGTRALCVGVRGDRRPDGMHPAAAPGGLLDLTGLSMRSRLRGPRVGDGTAADDAAGASNLCFRLLCDAVEGGPVMPAARRRELDASLRMQGGGGSEEDTADVSAPAAVATEERRATASLTPTSLVFSFSNNFTSVL